MWAHYDSIEPWVAWQRQSHRRRPVAISAGLVEQLSNGAEVWRLLLERRSDSVIELARGETLEELVEALRVTAQVAAALSHDLQQFPAVRRNVMEAIERAVLAPFAFYVLESAQVL